MTDKVYKSISKQTETTGRTLTTKFRNPEVNLIDSEKLLREFLQPMRRDKKTQERVDGKMARGECLGRLARNGKDHFDCDNKCDGSGSSNGNCPACTMFIRLNHYLPLKTVEKIHAKRKQLARIGVTLMNNEIRSYRNNREKIA